MQNKWISMPKPGAQLRLLCFPYAGGATAIFKGWPALIDPEVAVCPVRLPGREMRTRERLVCDLDTLVIDLANDLEPLFREPYALFGHSMGAIIVYELAALLAARGLPPPVHLFVSARPAPGLHRQIVSSPVAEITDDELLDSVRPINSPLTGMDHPEIRRLCLAILRADIQLCQSYRSEWHPALPCPLTAFGGDQDSAVPLEEVALWREATSSAFRMAPIHGDHFFVHDIATMAREVNADLAPALRRLRHFTAVSASPFLR